MEVRFANVYRQIQPDFTQVTLDPFLVLHVSGFAFLEAPALCLRLERPPPFSLLAPKGVKLHFKCHSPRENWVAFLDERSVKLDGETGFIALRYAGALARTASLKVLSEAEAQEARIEFSRLRDSLSSPLGSGAIRSRFALASLLRIHMGPNEESAGAAPEQRLRAFLDSPSCFGSSLVKTARLCGCSPDHLRRRFKARYGILPHDYLARRRMASAMDMISSGGLNASEVSEKLGFRHLSHFSAFFKAYFKMTPSEAAIRFSERGSAALPRRSL